MAEIELEFTDEEYDLIDKASKSLGLTIEDYIAKTIREFVERLTKACKNCGALAIATHEGVRHLRSRAFHCDLDDEDSLTATFD